VGKAQSGVAEAQHGVVETQTRHRASAWSHRG
jgi:hypothetical protein